MIIFLINIGLQSHPMIKINVDLMEKGEPMYIAEQRSQERLMLWQ